jgi:hypothetical protein
MAVRAQSALESVLYNISVISASYTAALSGRLDLSVTLRGGQRGRSYQRPLRGHLGLCEMEDTTFDRRGKCRPSPENIDWFVPRGINCKRPSRC